MRVLYLSRADEFRDKSSLVIIAKSVIKHMLAYDPEMYVTWVVPEGTKEEVLDEYVRAELPDPSRLGFLKVMAGVAGRTLGYFLTQDVWYAMTQTKVEVPYDVVLSNQMAMTPIWHTVLTNRYMASRYAVKVPIVNWQMWTATTQQLKEVPEYYAGEPDIVAESLSSMFATNVWESQLLLDAHVETMREYVKPHVVKKVLDQSYVIANGVDLPRLNDVRAKREKRMEDVDGPKLFWGGRLANQKKPRVSFPLMQEVGNAWKAKYGHDVEIVVSTNRPESDPDVEWTRDTFEDWALFTGVDRTAFFGLMAQGDVFMCNSASESYGVAWLEMMATGMLGVYEKFWWNEHLLPEWYPFVFDDKADMVKATLMLLETWPDGKYWTELVPKVQAWIAEEHTEVKAAQKMADLLNEEKRKAMLLDAGKGRGSMGQLAAAAAAELWSGEPMPEQAVYARMTDLSDSKREFGKTGDVVSRMYLRRCLEVNGWVDLSRSSQVEYVKRSQ